MFDLEKIKEIGRVALEEKWSYPKLFDALKDIGVERYETNVRTHEIKYVGGGASIIAPPPEGFLPLTIGPNFNREALKSAIERTGRRETTYAQFLAEIAAAGISFYRVDMRPRTITYHGPKPHKHVEQVPEA